MSKLPKILLVLFLACAIAPAKTANALANTDNDAITFVKDLTDKAKQTILTPNITREDKRKNFGKLFHDNVDLDWLSKFVLSRYWRQASPEEKQAFRENFEDVVVLTWSDRFDGYGSSIFNVNSVTPSEKGDQLSVNSSVLVPSEDPKLAPNNINVIWRLKKDGKTFKVIDINAEGVSMALTYRNEYSSVITNSGGKVSALIESIQKKVAELKK